MIRTITPLHKSYPLNLKRLTSPPPMLYVMGTIKPNDQHAVAIVGSRNMTNYGRNTAIRFTKFLVKNKITIISGLARGIDTVVHKEALKSGGRTIAVLGSGFKNFYPHENFNLAQKIAKNGAVITEFPPTTKPLAKNFLSRNRIISGLSKAVVVIEGAKKSGTISTATHAANQGIDVFAVPGPIDSPLSEATNYLISQGAAIATKPEDILDVMQ